uniref:Uncharacterized protein n=1 Tax=Arundo donax TaxID=35708 RepID=A0A0A9HDI4_ARUDO
MFSVIPPQAYLMFNLCRAVVVLVV